MHRLSNFFLGLGVAIGIVASVGLAVGFRPSELPAALLDLSVYKLTFIGAICVLAAGAVLRRSELRRRGVDGAATAAAQSALGEPATPDELAKFRATRQRDQERTH